LAVRWNYHGFDVAQRQEAAMSLYAAIDLHSSNSVLAVMDGEGKPALRCRRPNDLPRRLSDLAPYWEELVGVAVESTYNW
jgi:transposase